MNYYQKYRTAAKAVFTIPFLATLIVASVYCALTYFDIIQTPFEWEYLVALGGVVVVASFLAIWLLCISNSVKKREVRLAQEDEQMMDACAEQAVEDACIYIQQPLGATAPYETAQASFFCKQSKGSRQCPIKSEKVKKIATIAIPVAIVAVGVASAIAVKKKKDQRIGTLLRELEHELGYRK